MNTMRDGPGLPGITRADSERFATSVHRRARAGRAPGSVLIGVAAWLLALIGGGALFVSFSAQYAYIHAVRRQDAASVIEALLLDLGMIVFTLLALGLARAGKSARAERALILACAAASAYTNVAAADVASPRSVAAYAIAPLALAVVVDRVVAVIRRHVLADRKPSAWSTAGHAAAAAGRIAGLVLLYLLRFALAEPCRPGHAARRPAWRDQCHQHPVRPGGASRRPEPGRPVRGPGPDSRRGTRRRRPARVRCPVLDRPGPRHLPRAAGRPAAVGRYGAPPALRRLRAAGLLARPHPRRLGTVHPGRRVAPHLRRHTP